MSKPLLKNVEESDPEVSSNNISILSNFSTPKIENKGKIPVAGHFIDQMLKDNYPENNQLPFLESLGSKIKEEAVIAKITSEGVNLSPAENNFLMGTLLNLLHDNSEQNKESNNYLAGNYNLNSSPIPYGSTQKIKIPHIKISRSDLYRAHEGKPKYSGKTTKHVDDLLENLSRKQYLIRYTSQRKEMVKGKMTIIKDSFESLKPLIEVLNHKRTETSDGKSVDTKDEIIITLNPIFLHDIKTKFILLPSDLNQRLLRAAGGSNRSITVSVNNFIHYLLSNYKNAKIKINADKLIYKLRLDRYLKEGRKKQINKEIDKAISLAISIGLLKGFELTSGIEGQSMYIFDINPDFK